MRARLLFFMKRSVIGYAAALAVALAAPLAAHAETAMYLSPVISTVEVGGELHIGVFVDSGEVSLNAAEGALRYDPGKFRFVRADTASSILNSWTLVPTNDTSLATIKFAGIASAPYVGARGQIAEIVFEAIGPGDGEFVFDSAAAVHAADGSGANVLTKLGRAAFSVVPAGGEIAGVSTVRDAGLSDESSVGEVAGAVIETTDRTIASETHPDPERWYAATSSSLSWKLLDDIVEVRMGLSEDSDGSASVRYVPPTGSKILQDLEQGISYFHLLRIASDGSGTIEHFPLRIDSDPPVQFSVELIDRNDPTDPNIAFFVVATDTVSGIARVEFALDGGTAVPWTDDGSHRYTITGLAIGTHKLIGRAIDHAGNTASVEIEFVLEGIGAPSLSMPKREWKEGEIISLDGTAPPESTVTISVSRGPETILSAVIPAAADGTFSWTDSSPLDPGVFLVSAIASDARGAQSEPAQALELEVIPSIFGVLARHPLLPSGIGIVVLLASLGGWYWLRRAREDDHTLEDDKDREPALPEKTSIISRLTKASVGKTHADLQTKSATGFVVTLGSPKGGVIRRGGR
ncbi:MAG TPA: cohesin domain-containing protein [Candidatus Paceibacterota bacterium]|nr:cohesin domain-containing protein [Candidatus Paceibacterota bacterium]